MNAQAIDKLWQLPGADEVVGKDKAEDKYLQVVKGAERKLFNKQIYNSYELNATKEKITKSEGKLSELQKERRQLEEKLKNIAAREKAKLDKLNEIETFELNQLKEEAVALTDEVQEIKELERSLTRAFQLEKHDRFFGRYGDGSSTHLRKIHGLASLSDVQSLNGRELRAHLTFAQTFGAESMPSWVRKWGYPPIENWTDIAGSRAGAIMTHNGLSSEQLSEIMLHLYELSPIVSPIKNRKRKRSLSRGRSFSRGNSVSRGRSVSAASRGSAKRRRMSKDEIPAIVLSVTQALMDQGACEPDDSEAEYEE